ncbi:M23 family metallopeptidase [Lichenihabitans psoromatis]|uniref:M23 family metallopeptidase n=1 Tax=Lichenihabitans psoromatis TaxID=2528642 RepID=UPI0010362E3E|nr:M23 family metallopeptidase [Lichenihabitans psoromatis]
MGEDAGTSYRNSFAYPALDLGVDPPIEALGRRTLRHERRSISKRWLAATILTGLAGSLLIGTAIYAALDRQATFARPPEFASLTAKASADDATTGLRRGDRLLKTVDIVAEKQTFRAPTTVNIGDKQIIKLRGYTHVATTLTTTPTDLADEVPPFNPLKLLSVDAPNAPDAPADPGPVLDAAEVSFVTHDITDADPSLFSGALSLAEVVSQVDQQAKAALASGNRPPIPLPPQLLLMRTSRAGSDPTGGLAYANANTLGSPFSSIEVRMVPENVTVMHRSETPHDAFQSEERLVVLHHGDTIDDVLRANGATREQVRAIVDAFGAKRGEPPVGEGRRVRLLLASVDGQQASKQIARVSVYLDETLETTIALDDAGHYVKVEAAAPRQPAAAQASNDEPGDSGGMRLYDSIYQTALKQQIPLPIIEQMIRIFSNDVDFQQAVEGGDSFDAFYSNGDDGDGRQDLLFASLTVRDDIFRYYRYQSPDDPTPDYYDDAGRSVRKFLIRKPVPTGIFTSGFGVRFHPVLGYTRPHTGVDWAAPVGTPILAAGSGTVLKAERSSSYGNHVEIQHANGYITTYSHMVGFARGITDGVKVRQGQVIGYLGQTGLATGPHLHYEVIVNGHFVDPMRVKLDRTQSVSARLLPDFKREHDRIDALIASAPTAIQTSQKRASN